MEIIFVNHASFIIKTKDAQIICDPWIEGQVFNNGWALLSPTQLTYEDFSNITHIWFSHEHPDHFSPPNLKKIPEEYRQKITILFQSTIDRKVAEFCRKAGFGAIRELKPGIWEEISKNLDVLCSPWHGFEDSWICFRTPTVSILNVNDCSIATLDEAESIKQKVGNIDVLFTQFGISAWDGNPENLTRRLAGAKGMIDRTIMQTNVFRPKFVVPFASFIWFCHSENFYMNEGLSPIDKVITSIRESCEAIPITLYPGDHWRVGDETHNSALAIERYLADLNATQQRPLFQAEVIPEGKLAQASQDFCRKLEKNSDWLRLRAFLVMQTFRRNENSTRSLAIVKLLLWHIRPVQIYLTDYKQCYIFCLYDGLKASSIPPESCDIELGSQSLLYAFQNAWGGQALWINGCFRELNRVGCQTLFDYFSLAGEMNAGRDLRWLPTVKNLAKTPKLTNQL